MNLQCDQQLIPCEAAGHETPDDTCMGIVDFLELRGRAIYLEQFFLAPLLFAEFSLGSLQNKDALKETL